MDVPGAERLAAADRLRLAGAIRVDPALEVELTEILGALEPAGRDLFLGEFLRLVPDQDGRPAAAVLPALALTLRRGR